MVTRSGHVTMLSPVLWKYGKDYGRCCYGYSSLVIVLDDDLAAGVCVVIVCRVVVVFGDQKKKDEKNEQEVLCQRVNIRLTRVLIVER